MKFRKGDVPEIEPDKVVAETAQLEQVVRYRQVSSSVAADVFKNQIFEFISV